MAITLPNNWKPRWYQRPAWDYLERGGKHCELVWHRRGGKDELALHRTAVGMTERAGNYWHMLPRANQARKALWDAINPHTGKRRIDEAFPQELHTGYNDHEMMLKIGESTWQVVGSDNFDSLVGSPPIGLTFSEWALSEPSSWAYLRPIIAENNGWVIFNTTPRGKNHAYRTFRAAQKEPGHFAQKLTALQTDVFTKEQLEAERRQLIAEYGLDYGQSLFDQEYLCSFEAANLGAILGRALTRAMTQGRLTNDVFDPDGAPIEISSDIGRRDSSSWWFWQPRTDGFAIVHHDRASGLQAGEWCDRLARIIKDSGYKLAKIWLPHDARAKTFAAKDTAIEQFIDYFGFDKIDVTPNSHKSDRINAARTIIENCWFDNEACDAGLEGLAAWTYEYNEETKEFSLEPKHDWACFTQDTEVLTRYGTCQIMNLPKNGEVLTPCGWKTYQGPKITRKNARLVEVAFRDGHTVKCTPDHMFLTESGWKSAECLTQGSLIRSSLTPSRSILMVGYIAYGRVSDILRGAALNCIETCGNLLSVISRQIATSTTGTGILKTTIYPISNVSTQSTTQTPQRETRKQRRDSLNLQGKKQQNGIIQKQGCFGINDTANASRSGLNGRGLISLALSVGQYLRRLVGQDLTRKNSAQTYAELLIIESVSPLKERADTCCICVPDGEWFSLANGAVVHNSHDGDSFSYGALVMRLRIIEEKKPEPHEAAFKTGLTLEQLWAETPKYANARI